MSCALARFAVIHNKIMRQHRAIADSCLSSARKNAPIDVAENTSTTALAYLVKLLNFGDWILVDPTAIHRERKKAADIGLKQIRHAAFARVIFRGNNRQNVVTCDLTDVTIRDRFKIASQGSMYFRAAPQIGQMRSGINVQDFPDCPSNAIERPDPHQSQGRQVRSHNQIQINVPAGSASSAGRSTAKA
jgi:hypothetical protein